MDPTILSFSIAGGVLALGFIGDYFFRKYKIPDVLILIFIGMLIGPIFHIINPNIFSGALSQIFIALALVMILFNCGLNLSLDKVFEESSRAFTLASLGVFFSIIFTSIFMKYIMGWDWMYGILLGTVIGGSSSSIVIPLISRLKTPSRIKTLLSLESAFTDVIVIILGITFIKLVVSKDVSAIYEASKEITAAFSIGAFFGLLVGLAWIRILKYISWNKYQDIFTISVLLLFYAISELLGGSGAMFALFFGLILGNGISISKFFRMKDTVSASSIMKRFQSEITFFVRTFFFVYMGMLFSFMRYDLIIFGVIISFILLFGRWISVKMMSLNNELIKKHSLLITGMLSRGLAAAVVAQMVFSSGIKYASTFPDLTLTIIMTTVIISVVISSIRG